MGKAENFVEGYLVDKAESLGFLCYKFMSGHNGVPDRILIGNGKVFFIETKSRNGKLSEMQKVVHRKFLRRGIKVFVPNTREQVDEIIEELMRG